MLHDAETLFNLPTPVIDPNNRFRIIIKVCRNGIEAIILLLFPNLGFIQRVLRAFCNLAVLRHGNPCNEPFIIALPCAFLLNRRSKRSLGAGNLLVSDFSLVAAVFQGKGYDILLLNVILVKPSLFVEGPLKILFAKRLISKNLF